MAPILNALTQTDPENDLKVLTDKIKGLKESVLDDKQREILAKNPVENCPKFTNNKMTVKV